MLTTSFIIQISKVVKGVGTGRTNVLEMSDERERWRNKKFICDIYLSNDKQVLNCSLTIPEIESCRANGIEVVVHPDKK